MSGNQNHLHTALAVLIGAVVAFVFVINGIPTSGRFSSGVSGVSAELSPSGMCLGAKEACQGSYNIVNSNDCWDTANCSGAYAVGTVTGSSFLKCSSGNPSTRETYESWVMPLSECISSGGAPYCDSDNYYHHCEPNNSGLTKCGTDEIFKAVNGENRCILEPNVCKNTSGTLRNSAGSVIYDPNDPSYASCTHDIPVPPMPPVQDCSKAKWACEMNWGSVWNSNMNSDCWDSSRCDMSRSDYCVKERTSCKEKGGIWKPIFSSDTWTHGNCSIPGHCSMSSAPEYCSSGFLPMNEKEKHNCLTKPDGTSTGNKIDIEKRLMPDGSYCKAEVCRVGFQPPMPPVPPQPVSYCGRNEYPVFKASGEFDRCISQNGYDKCPPGTFPIIDKRGNFSHCECERSCPPCDCHGPIPTPIPVPDDKCFGVMCAMMISEFVMECREKGGWLELHDNLPPEARCCQDMLTEKDAECRLPESHPGDHFNIEDFNRERKQIEKDLTRGERDLGHEEKMMIKDLSRIERDLQNVNPHDTEFIKQLNMEKAGFTAQLATVKEVGTIYADLSRRLGLIDPKIVKDPWHELEKIRFQIEMARLIQEIKHQKLELDRQRIEVERFGAQNQFSQIFINFESRFNSIVNALNQLKTDVSGSTSGENWWKYRERMDDIRFEREGLWMNIDELRWQIDELRQQGFNRQVNDEFMMFFELYNQITNEALSFLSKAGYDVSKLEEVFNFPRPWLEKAMRAAKEGRHDDIGRIMSSIPQRQIEDLLGKALIPIIDKLVDDVLDGEFDSEINMLLERVRQMIAATSEAVPPELPANVEILKDILRKEVETARNEYGSIGNALKAGLESGLGAINMTDPYAGEYDDSVRMHLGEMNVDTRELHKEWASHAKDIEFKKFVAISGDANLKEDVAHTLGTLGSLDKEMRGELLTLKQEIFNLRTEIGNLIDITASVKNDLNELTKLASRAPLTKAAAEIVNEEIAKVTAGGNINDASMKALRAKISGLVEQSVDELWQKGEISFTDLHPKTPEDRDFSAFDKEIGKIKGKLVGGVDQDGKNFNPGGLITKNEAGVLALALAAGVERKADLGLPHVGWEGIVVSKLKELGITNRLGSEPISRGEFFELMAKAARIDMHDLESDCFADSNNAAICALRNYGVVKGFADNTIKPNISLNRAEAALVASRVLGVRDILE